MKLSYALLLAGSLAFVACGDEDSPAGPSTDYDCSVTGGVKVVYPTKGETFKIGDEITVVYGTDVNGSGYHFYYRTSKDVRGMDLFDGSEGLEGKGDGKTCYTQKVKLSVKDRDGNELLEPSKTAVIRVTPYEDTNKGNDSGEFTLNQK